MEQYFAALTLALLGGFATVARRWVQAHITPDRLQTVLNLTRTVVSAADEVARASGISGPDKYAYAENALTSAAKRVGFNLKPEEANAFIHAVLNEVHKAEDELLNPPDDALLQQAFLAGQVHAKNEAKGLATEVAA